LIVEASSELVLLPASTLEPSIYTTHEKRPLRFWDLVTLDTIPYVVLSCNPAWQNDVAQMQHMELSLYRGGIFFQ
jgi:hypothetical protein